MPPLPISLNGSTINPHTLLLSKPVEFVVVDHPGASRRKCSKGFPTMPSHYSDVEIAEIGKRAWKTASRAAKHMSKHSKIVNPSMEKCIPRFEREEVILGDVLGSGGFNDVYEVKRINLIEDLTKSKHAKKISSPLQNEHRSFVAKHVFRESSQNCRYAVKFLSVETIEDPNRFCTGAADLVVEAKFLASLSHPNIIKLRGMAAAGTSGFASMKERGYFLLLDRLQCTLEHKIDHWRNFERAIDLDRKKGAFLAERLHVAFDVAAALSYLHANNILYRDLKPDNIGFDVRGDVKIFDFGLAKELDPSLRHGCTEFYELSGNTGSLRYMSPEVARCEPYNLTADVYSFGLLLWQVCSLMLPYDGMNRQDHSELVVYGNERPPLDSAWSTPLRILMKRAWEPDPSVRPSMESIYKILRREICALRDGDDTGLEHFSRRSTFVLNRDSMVNPASGGHGDLDKQSARGGMLPRSTAMSRKNAIGQASQRALINGNSQRGGAMIRQGSQGGHQRGAYTIRQGSQMISNYSQRGDSNRALSNNSRSQCSPGVTGLPPFALDRKTSDTAMVLGN